MAHDGICFTSSAVLDPCRQNAGARLPIYCSNDGCLLQMKYKHNLRTANARVAQKESPLTRAFSCLTPETRSAITDLAGFTGVPPAAARRRR
jgi:hypothetical protein